LRNSGARRRSGRGKAIPFITIQEAGLDGFWLHRVLQQNGIESHVVDPASIATPRRPPAGQDDRLDGETLLRALLAYKRGEPRSVAMVVAPSPEEEDRRPALSRTGDADRRAVTHVNRIKGLLFSQGISDYAPLRRDRRSRLETLRTGDGRELPSHLRAQIGANSIGLNCLSNRSRRSRPSGMPCWRRRESLQAKRPRRTRSRCCSP